jgi:hypothetical protein
MKPVFSLPVGANYPIQAMRIVVRGAWKRADVIPSFHTCLVQYLLCVFHHYQRRQIWPTLTRFQACKRLHTLDLAGLYAPVSPIPLGVIAQYNFLINGIGASKSLKQLCAIPV